ncbi:MAG: hypothetical protein MI724_01385, partial [Spirochaetales bacterium]|nr:hypothetical protein [Spirochaetales bacterium]
VGGRAKAGLPIKIQAEVEDETVVLCGIIKSANFKQKNRASVLHIQAERPSQTMRVKILSYVYQLFDAGETRTELEGAHPAPTATSNPQQASTPRQRAAAAASAQERKQD